MNDAFDPTEKSLTFATRAPARCHRARSWRSRALPDIGDLGRLLDQCISRFSGAGAHLRRANPANRVGGIFLAIGALLSKQERTGKVTRAPRSWIRGGQR